MRVLVGDRWSEEYLDPTPVPTRRRLEVHRQLAVLPVVDQYFVRRPRVSMLFAYLRALGPRRVWRKVRSRRAESARNDAWLSVGVGRDGDDDLLFVLPSAPRGATRALVPDVLTWPWPAGRPVPGAGHFTAPGSAADRLPAGLVDALRPLAGWSDEAGNIVVPADLPDRLAALVADPGPAFSPAPRAPIPGPVRERQEGGVGHGPLGFTCFGYGQYAKTQAIANLGRHLHLDGVHELDPVQIGVVPVDGCAWDTSGHPRPEEQIHTAVLAGYHHTHAPLAVDLLDRGTRHVIIEKPLATTHQQLDALLAAMERHPEARVHAAFQRRHAPLNRHLFADLGGRRASMSATVYEVPLPALHWYRWPVVGNSVISNGCHWIDYFLFVNDFSPVVSHHASAFDRHVLLAMELENGASCSISLRHEGSPRLGVRDLVTFWNGETTVTIEDNSSYRSERGFRAGRRRTCPRLQAHEDMYLELGRRIAADEAGDSVRSIDVSTRAVLRLAELVDEAVAARRAPRAGAATHP